MRPGQEARLDRKAFLSVAGTAPLAPLAVPAPSSLGVKDLRLLVTVGGVNRIAVLTESSTFAILSVEPGQTRTANVPRPTSDESRWQVADPPSAPIVNPHFQNDDVIYDAVPDAVTASTVYRTGVIFAFKPRIGRAYLVYVLPNRTSVQVRPLERGGEIMALFPAPDGLHVVLGADAQFVVPYPAL